MRVCIYHLYIGVYHPGGFYLVTVHVVEPTKRYRQYLIASTISNYCCTEVTVKKELVARIVNQALVRIIKKDPENSVLFAIIKLLYCLLELYINYCKHSKHL